MRAVTHRRGPLAIALAVAALPLVAFACTGGRTPRAEDDPHRPIPAVNATTADLLPTDAAALPEFDLARFRSLLEELRGTPVLVNVWGSWCAPCRAEAADLVAAHARFGEAVQFVGVDVLDARGSAREYLREHRITYPSVFDPPGRIRDGLGLLGQPVTLLYDRAGSLVDRWNGPVPPSDLDGALARIASGA
jgi:thiol-disulfide isomerase/thioredoxin